MNRDDNFTLSIGKLSVQPRVDMPLLEAIHSRRTVRRYQKTLVPQKVIEEILFEATNAPSDCNRQGWKCILINEKKTLQWLYFRGGASFLRDQRQALLVCYLNTSDNREWNDEIQSAAAFISYFQLIAHTRGIGSCWICHLPPRREIRRYFKIPNYYQPIALLSFGFYLPNQKVIPRSLPHKKPVCREKWNFPDTELIHDKPSFVRRIMRWLYYFFPWRGIIRKWTEAYEKKFFNEPEKY